MAVISEPFSASWSFVPLRLVKSHLLRVQQGAVALPPRRVWSTSHRASTIMSAKAVSSSTIWSDLMNSLVATRGGAFLNARRERSIKRRRCFPRRASRKRRHEGAASRQLSSSSRGASRQKYFSRPHVPPQRPPRDILRDE